MRALRSRPRPSLGEQRGQTVSHQPVDWDSKGTHHIEDTAPRGTRSDTGQSGLPRPGTGREEGSRYLARASAMDNVAATMAGAQPQRAGSKQQSAWPLYSKRTNHGGPPEFLVHVVSSEACQAREVHSGDGWQPLGTKAQPASQPAGEAGGGYGRPSRARRRGQRPCLWMKGGQASAEA